MEDHFEIDSKKFNAMIAKLAAELKRPMVDVLRKEVAAILSKTMDRTKASKKSMITKRWKIPASRSAAMPRSIVKHVFFGGRFTKVRGRHSLNTYAALKARMDLIAAYKIDRIGSSRATWLKIAEELNLDEFITSDRKDQAKVALANQRPSFKGVSFGSERGSKESLSEDYTIKISTASSVTLNKNAGGTKALLQSINGRIGYFKANLRNKVFESADAIAKKYGGYAA